MKKFIDNFIHKIKHWWWYIVIYKSYLKRIFDITLAIVAIIILSPILLIIALFVKIDSKGPLFFKQLRVGKNKKEFYIFKFRTMKIDTPSYVPTFLLENPEIHITKLGGILRKTSLDELPQLINIIKGDMSFIGPRPTIRKEIELYNEREKNRVYEITPGLTGWAQINGRDQISLEDKVKLDSYYLNNISLKLDMKILFLTIVKVIKSEGFREGMPLMNRRKSHSKIG